MFVVAGLKSFVSLVVSLLPTFLLLASLQAVPSLQHLHANNSRAIASSTSKLGPFTVISAKPCQNALGEVGTCMFMWDCIKSEGKHLGTCSDRFLFGSCCYHNIKTVDSHTSSNSFENNNNKHSTSALNANDLHATTKKPAMPTTSQPFQSLLASSHSSSTNSSSGSNFITNKISALDKRTNQTAMSLFSQASNHNQSTSQRQPINQYSQQSADSNVVVAATSGIAHDATNNKTTNESIFTDLAQQQAANNEWPNGQKDHQQQHNDNYYNNQDQNSDIPQWPSTEGSGFNSESSSTNNSLIQPAIPTTFSTTTTTVRPSQPTSEYQPNLLLRPQLPFQPQHQQQQPAPQHVSSWLQRPVNLLANTFFHTFRPLNFLNPNKQRPTFRPLAQNIFQARPNAVQQHYLPSSLNPFSHLQQRLPVMAAAASAAPTNAIDFNDAQPTSDRFNVQQVLNYSNKTYGNNEPADQNQNQVPATTPQVNQQLSNNQVATSAQPIDYSPSVSGFNPATFVQQHADHISLAQTSSSMQAINQATLPSINSNAEKNNQTTNASLLPFYDYQVTDSNKLDTTRPTSFLTTNEEDFQQPQHHQPNASVNHQQAFTLSAAPLQSTPSTQFGSNSDDKFFTYQNNPTSVPFDAALMPWPTTTTTAPHFLLESNTSSSASSQTSSAAVIAIDDIKGLSTLTNDSLNGSLSSYPSVTSNELSSGIEGTHFLPGFMEDKNKYPILEQQDLSKPPPMQVDFRPTTASINNILGNIDDEDAHIRPSHHSGSGIQASNEFSTTASNHSTIEHHQTSNNDDSSSGLIEVVPSVASATVGSNSGGQTFQSLSPTTSSSVSVSTQQQVTASDHSTSTHNTVPLRQPASRDSCGVQVPHPAPKVVGGKNAAFGAWPWQVSVRKATFLGFSSNHRCGGAIISSEWIATAGHCVEDLNLSAIRIRVGEYDFASNSEPHPFIEGTAKRKVVHPGYNYQTYENDLALVQLNQPLRFPPHIKPICLPPDENDLLGKNATVTGWGRLNEGGPLPSVLQEVRVPIISNDVCKNMFAAAGRPEYIPEIFLCAGYEDGGRDSCQGDSGGPLQVKGDDGKWFLAGIISWGIGCAERNLPGVCTRISKFKQWIQSTTNTNI